MNNVITSEQAKKITGGRTPLVPVEYEQAVNALQACLTLDEAKYWSDKADALAAWAQIHRSDEAGRKSRALKLYAYRRMGELAGDLRKPTYAPSGSRSGKSLQPGPKALLIESGLRPGQAGAARKVASMTQREFEAVVARQVVPSVHVLSRKLRESPEWFAFTDGFKNTRTFCKNNEPRKFARSLSMDEATKARLAVTDVIEWLDAFEQALPKAK